MRNLFLSAAAILAVLAQPGDAAENQVIGIVNFTSCVTESKAGQKEQENMDNLRKQMSSMMENIEKELREISAKFDDTEYLDGLSPKAEEELKAKHQALQEDLVRYQQQFYQVLNHAHYQMLQKINTTIAAASQIVATEKELDYVINREACFYVRPDLDVTNLVIEEMDKSFEFETSQSETSSDSENDLEQVG